MSMRHMEALLTLLQRKGVSEPEARRLYADLVVAYSAATRHYHTLSHIYAVLDVLHDLRPLARNWEALVLAAWFHDVVYVWNADDNEAASARYAETRLRAAGISAGLATEVARLIRATDHRDASPAHHDAQLLVDADLAPLGTPPAQYALYAAAIRREYQALPLRLYLAGRQAMLHSLIDRPRIYHTERMYDLLEHQARHNLRRELDRIAHQLAELDGDDD